MTITIGGCPGLSSTMSVSIDELPQEIIALIVSYLPKGSLPAVLRTARFLRPHAERLLYRSVDLHAGPTSQTRTIDFLIKVVRNPRLGSLVSSFYPDVVNYHMALASTGEFVDLLPYAMRFLPNLKTIALGQGHWIPKCLRWHPTQTPPFQLRRLALRTLHIRDSDVPELGRDVLQLLQKQPDLRHVSLSLPAYSHPCPFPETPHVLEKICPALEVLEGTNSVIRLLLPKRRVKSLLWECDRPYREPLRSPRSLETDLRLRDDLFTPDLCEAYGRLENLVIYEQMSLLPILSAFLKSLKTLLLSVNAFIDSDDPQSVQSEESLLLGAIGEMENLEVLAITLMGKSDIRLHHRAVFSASKKLKHFAFFLGGNGQILEKPVFMERGADGAIYPVAREVIFDVPYLHNGWFTFGTASL